MVEKEGEQCEFCNLLELDFSNIIKSLRKVQKREKSLLMKF